MPINHKQKGFTLIELLVVIAIIALLATLSIVAVKYAIQKAKISIAQNDINEIYKAVSMLVNDSGEWPGHQTVDVICTALPGGCPANNEFCGPDLNNSTCNNGLNGEEAGIMLDDSGNAFANWSGPYMPNLSDDPWGREYFFDTDYEIKTADNTPCDGGVVGVDCRNAVVIGSYGPDMLGAPTGGAGAYGADDIIKVIK